MTARGGPFPGPVPFPLGGRDKYPFCGREREAADLADLVLSYRTVVLHAPSGAGKTSLLNAGLLPRLTEEGVQILGARLAPTERTRKTKNVFMQDGFASLQVIEGGATPRWKPLPRAELSRLRSGGTTLLLLDQFEEVFSSNPWEWRQRRAFFKLLTWALSRHPDLHLLLALREDHLADLEAFAHLFPNQLRVRYRLDKLRAVAARRALVEPLVTGGWKRPEAEFVTSGVVKDLLETKAPDGQPMDGELVEPLHLQIQANQIWRSKSNPRASAKPQPVEPIDRALRRVYERAIARASGLNVWRQRRLRRWFSKVLITPAGTRGMAFVDDQKTKGVSSRALALLAGEGVIRSERRSNATWCELAHDRFIEPVRESNREWQSTMNLGAVAVMVLLVGALGAMTLKSVKARNARLEAGNEELRASTEQLQASEKQKTVALAQATEIKQQQAAFITQIVATSAKPSFSSPAALENTSAPVSGNRERARSLWQQGYRAFNGGKEADARTFYTRAIEADSSYAPAYNSLGRLAIDDGDLPGAEVQLKAAIARDPKYAPAYQNLAVMYALQNRFDEAQHNVEMALQINPSFSQAKRLAKNLPTASR
ncbi:MAG TPA: tetratricopeptide repeat protein [Polyangia bacterium]|nr:tetratricopeptide repeat protein [Polyangia bacterium]